MYKMPCGSGSHSKDLVSIWGHPDEAHPDVRPNATVHPFSHTETKITNTNKILILINRNFLDYPFLELVADNGVVLPQQFWLFPLFPYLAPQS